MHALILAGLLSFCATTLLVAAAQEPSEETPERDEQSESGQAEDEPRPRRPPGLLPLSVRAEVDLGSRLVGPALPWDEKTLVLATASGEVRGLDAATGETRWRLGMPGEELFPPHSVSPGILISSRSGTLRFIRPESGEILREQSLGVPLAVPPAGNETTLFLATPDGEVLAYDREAQEEYWSSKVQAPPLTLSVGAGLVLISDRSGGLHALDAPTGRLRWQFQGRGNFEAPAVFDATGERLYLGDTAGFFYSLSVREGKVHYRWATGAAIVHRVLLDEDRLFLVSYANTLFCYRTGNGHELWRANLPGRPAAAPVRSRRRVVVLTLNGGVIEYAPGGQAGASMYTAPEEVLPYPTFVPEGLVLPLRSGNLLLLRTRQPPPAGAEEPPAAEPEAPQEPEDVDEPSRPSATLHRTPLSPKTAAEILAAG